MIHDEDDPELVAMKTYVLQHCCPHPPLADVKEHLKFVTAGVTKFS